MPILSHYGIMVTPCWCFFLIQFRVSSIPTVQLEKTIARWQGVVPLTVTNLLIVIYFSNLLLITNY